MSQAEDLPDELLLDIDAESVGFYAFPIQVIELEGIPPLPLRKTLFVRRTEQGYVLPGNASGIRAGVRIRPQGSQGVHQWLTCPRNTAWGWLLAALPQFYLSRYRLNGKLRKLLVENEGLLDIEELGLKRARDRHQLFHHQQSLGQKTWGVRYHRQRFTKLMGDAAAGIDARTNILHANHELIALDGITYALLDETALVINLLLRVAKGTETPTSFSYLFKSTKIPQELAKILTDLTWYESFHERRTGSAHAFAPVLHLAGSNDISDIRLFQQPHPKYNRQSPTMPTEDEIAELRFQHESMISSFDAFLSDIGEYLLGLFHVNDTVSMHV